VSAGPALHQRHDHENYFYEVSNSLYTPEKASGSQAKPVKSQVQVQANQSKLTATVTNACQRLGT
jgi:hypothetical protein